MNPFECPREQEVLEAVASRRWPTRCDEELRAHVTSCAVCADLATVAAALLDADGEAPAGGLPPASLVWWRAQLRARQEAARSALRPIRLTQGVAAVCALALAIVAVSFVLPQAWNAVATAAERLPDIDVHALVMRIASVLPAFDADAASQAALAALANRGVQLAAGAWLILAPVAIYLAFARD